MPARKAQTLYFPRFTKIYLTETKSPCIILLLYFCFVDLVAGQAGAKLSDANLHEFVHTEKVTWKCEECKETFEEKMNFKEHKGRSISHSFVL